MSLAEELASQGMNDASPAQLIEQPTVPLWKGPEVDGVTFSLLNRYIMDKERFYLYAYQGIGSKESFNNRLEYGNMWHTCEEAIAHPERKEDWKSALLKYCKGLCDKFRYDKEEIDKWYNVCATQFAVYLTHNKISEQQRTDITPLLSEHCFSQEIVLPSGRIVKLRGKWDSVYFKKHDRGDGIWIQENKTKGEINESDVATQLKYDLQTMLYVVALRHFVKGKYKYPVVGVDYNVVRRPLSGGRHSITRHKPTKKNVNGESKQEFYKRLFGLIKGEPNYFFMRWHVRISDDDVDIFTKQTLIPLLEELCSWWEMITAHPDERFSVIPGLHYRMPYGLYSPLTDKKATEYDRLLETGDMSGLTYRKTVFPELDS